MGVVWLAYDRHLEEEVALKFLPPQLTPDPEAVSSLRREVTKSRKLSHPNIVRIHDLVLMEGEPPFLSMEFVEGTNLGTLKAAQPNRLFHWEEIEPVVQQLCAALDYAHREKVAHRDLKPGNMMLHGNGRLKLADFGLAATLTETISKMTRDLGVSGTVAYMSPQQLDGELPTASDDIYAFGASLYELLTSKPPFFTGDIPHQIRNLAPKPMEDRLRELELANEIPASVAALTMARLAKERETRPSCAREIADWIGLDTREFVAAAFPPSDAPQAGEFGADGTSSGAADVVDHRVSDSADVEITARGGSMPKSLIGAIVGVLAVGILIVSFNKRGREGNDLVRTTTAETEGSDGSISSGANALSPVVSSPAAKAVDSSGDIARVDEFIRAENWAEAARELKSFLKANPPEFSTSRGLLLGTLYSATGEYSRFRDAHEEHCRRFFELYAKPQEPLDWARPAKAYVIFPGVKDPGLLAKADEHSKQALKLLPERDWFHLLRAMLEYRRENHPEVIRLLEMPLESGNRQLHVAALAFEAMSRFRLGDKSAAQTLLKKAESELEGDSGNVIGNHLAAVAAFAEAKATIDE